jgi:rhodanese-related sulfurtransferase
MTPDRERPREVAPEDLLAGMELRAAPLVIDVRSHREYAQGHVPGAINIAFWRLWTGTVDLPAAPDDPIVVYCGHGPRAQIAASALRRRGFRNLRYLAGHMAGWRRAGLPEKTG